MKKTEGFIEHIVLSLNDRHNQICCLWLLRTAVFHNLYGPCIFKVKSNIFEVMAVL